MDDPIQSLKVDVAGSNSVLPSSSSAQEVAVSVETIMIA
jgi:hypothetical protein